MKLQQLEHRCLRIPFVRMNFIEDIEGAFKLFGIYENL